MPNESILQSWVQEQPLKMQTVLCLGTRGPDTHSAPELKKIVRWVRAQIYKPADPTNPHFMFSSLQVLPEIVEKSPVAKELEFCTQHYFAHLMHALEIIGYRHPDSSVAWLAMERYIGMVKLFHLHAETAFELAKRLGWMEWAQGQPQNFEEAMRASHPRDAEGGVSQGSGSFADHRDFLPDASAAPGAGEAILPTPSQKKPCYEKEHCHADRDGECFWEGCPQNRDGEPEKSGRSCPLYQREEED